MAGAGGADFTIWLNTKLRELNTDENIFGSYITGILEGDENNDEKTEALEGILSEIIETNLDTIIKEILDKWNDCQPKADDVKKKPILDDVDTQLARILETQKLQTVVQRQYTADELRIREQILAQYSQTAVSEEEDEEGEVVEETGSSGLMKNTNALEVQQLQKERREQAKIDSLNKKEKDKQDREKQKQLKEDKKEKRKTVKGERRR